MRPDDDLEAASGWRVCVTRRDIPRPTSPLLSVADLPPDVESWLDTAGVPEGTPFLLSPLFEYDVDLNCFFQCPQMVGASANTQVGYARDIAGG
jgi:hypothetical protein